MSLSKLFALSTLVWLLTSNVACSQKTSADESYTFDYREIYLPEINSREAGSLDLNSINTDWGIWGHNLAAVLPKGHSASVYARINGQISEEQFCFSSDKLYSYIVQYVDNNYGRNDTQRFAILPNDNSIVCLCDRCVAAGNSKTDASPAVFVMIQRLAEHFPKHMFFTSYYSTTKKTPKRLMPKNSGVLVSAINYPLVAGHTLEEEQFCNLLKDWHKFTDNIYVWDYINNFDDYFTPFPTFNVMQRRFYIYANNGVKGIFLNGSGSDYSSLYRIKTYILAKLMQNPKADWHSLLKEYCHSSYPSSGDCIIDFIEQQEKWALEQQQPLPLYGGINDAIRSYLPEDDFIRFHDQLEDVLEKASGQEYTELLKLYKSLIQTRLELMRVRGDIEGYQAHLNELTSLIQDGINIYSESCWTLESYINDYRFMGEHALQMSKKNKLTGIKLKPLSTLDPEYSDISILTDGLLGLPSNYHCGHLIFSSDSELKIEIPNDMELSHVNIWVTHNPLFRIGLPLKATLKIGGVEVAKAIPQLLQSGDNHSVITFNLPQHISGSIVVSLSRNPEIRTIAIDEIEAW